MDAFRPAFRRPEVTRSVDSGEERLKITAVISADELTRHGADWAPFSAMLGRFRDWRYDAVELGVRDPAHLDVAALQRCLEAAPLPVAALATGTTYVVDGLSYTHPNAAVRRAARQRIAEHCALAAQLGSLVIVGLVRGRQQPGTSRGQTMAWVHEGLAAACEAAQQHGVSLVFEPINRYETDLVNTTEEGLALLQEVRAPHLGLLLDTYHMNIEDPDICASFRQAGRHVRHVHTADSNRWYPGAGHVDFAAVVATLGEVGYHGYLSAEILPRPDLNTSLERAAASLRRLVGR